MNQQPAGKSPITGEFDSGAVRARIGDRISTLAPNVDRRRRRFRRAGGAGGVGVGAAVAIILLVQGGGLPSVPAAEDPTTLSARSQVAQESARASEKSGATTAGPAATPSPSEVFKEVVNGAVPMSNSALIAESRNAFGRLKATEAIQIFTHKTSRNEGAKTLSAESLQRTTATIDTSSALFETFSGLGTDASGERFPALSGLPVGAWLSVTKPDGKWHGLSVDRQARIWTDEVRDENPNLYTATGSQGVARIDQSAVMDPVKATMDVVTRLAENSEGDIKVIPGSDAVVKIGEVTAQCFTYTGEPGLSNKGAASSGGEVCIDTSSKLPVLDEYHHTQADGGRTYTEREVRRYSWISGDEASRLFDSVSTAGTTKVSNDVYREKSKLVPVN